MEAVFRVFHVGDVLIHHPPTQRRPPNQARSTRSARTREGARTTPVVLALCNPPSTWGYLNRTHCITTPRFATRTMELHQKPRRRCQVALRRFLATSATIGRTYAPDFDGAYPQGVNRDSLESSNPLQAREVPKHARVQEPHAWFLPFGASHHCGVV